MNNLIKEAQARHDAFIKKYAKHADVTEHKDRGRLLAAEDCEEVAGYDALYVCPDCAGGWDGHAPGCSEA